MITYGIDITAYEKGQMQTGHTLIGFPFATKEAAKAMFGKLKKMKFDEIAELYFPLGLWEKRNELESVLIVLSSDDEPTIAQCEITNK